MITKVIEDVPIEIYREWEIWKVTEKKYGSTILNTKYINQSVQLGPNKE